ncbi:hypothetical protein GGR51DRAFT_268294 [Nemania sp. FL0031]|nr:hypothetical protein GGR51DRAFT_268294 [Nemania sp. FL0031]
MASECRVLTFTLFVSYLFTSPKEQTRPLRFSIPTRTQCLAIAPIHLVPICASKVRVSSPVPSIHESSMKIYPNPCYLWLACYAFPAKPDKNQKQRKM